MNIPYIIQVQICIALFWIAYRLFMRNSGAFSHNRMYLLGFMALSFVIPALSIPIWPAPVNEGTILVGDLANWDAFIIPEEEAVQVISWQDAVWIIAALGAVVILFGALRHTFRMIRSVKRSGTHRIENAHVVYDERIHAPYSFFHYIFINATETGRGELPQIVAHEMAHIRLRHSYDSVFAQLMLVLFWWNPFVWLWSRSLKEVHEYQADMAVLDQGFDSKQYITLLIGTLADIHPEFVSGFSYSLIKNRLLMMTKQTSRFAKWRVLAVIPVLGVTLLLFTFTEKAQAISPKVESVGTTETISTPVQAESVVINPVQLPQGNVAPPPSALEEPFVAVEEMPLFQGGDQKSFQRWVMTNLNYPAEAQQKGIEGRVILGFVIEKDGSLSHVEVIESPDNILTEEAVRAVSASPKWTAGRQRGQNVRVRFTMPLDFRLHNNTTNTTTQPTSSSSASITVVGYGPTSSLGSSGSEPTILVNGERYTGNIQNITSDNIEYINVVKNDPAHPNGVIHITLKEGASSPETTTFTVTQNNGDNQVIYTPNTEDATSKITITGTGTTEGRVSKITVSRIGTMGSTEGQPLFIVDGTRVAEISSIPADNIESISVLKDESSIREYGEEGKNGVVIITTKKEAANN